MIAAIFIAPQFKQPQQQVQTIELIAGKGIVGDRNFDQAKWPGQNITLIEAEKIERFNADYQQQIPLQATRRNIITRGVRLNDLVGHNFTIGGVKFYGVELCEPCSYVGQLLGNDTISQAQAVKAWVHHSGLRADIISNGTIAVGMAITATDHP